MRVAFLDLDHTLLVADSNQLWMSFLLSQQMISVNDVATHEKFMDDYSNGVLDFSALQSFRIKLDASLPVEQMDKCKKIFFKKILLPAIAPLASRLLEEIKSQGVMTVVVSATRATLIEPVAKQLGVDHVLSSCFGQDKVNQVEFWLESYGKSLLDLDESWFYSDSHNDLPLFEAVKFPIAVDPNSQLKSIADCRNWKIISLHS
ncbi:MAG: hypothetical protein RLZZ189_2285 [Pseudomonadota bacterium]|jgi:phosphoserine phosphatase